MEKLLESLLTNPEILSEFNDEIQELNRKNDELLQRIKRRVFTEQQTQKDKKECKFSYLLNKNGLTLIDRHDNGPLVLANGSISQLAEQIASWMFAADSEKQARGLELHKLILKRDIRVQSEE